MIPFFRKIRKQFADDNKPLKYMRYAIGEVILVMIGILLALQVNNWNEERKKNTLEKAYLSQINAEFKNNKIQLDRIKAIRQRMGEHCKVLDSLMPFTVQDWDSLKSKIYEVLRTVSFDPTQGSIESFINSSAMDIISDPELGRLLLQWSAMSKDYQEDERVLNEQIWKSVDWLNNNTDRSNLSLFDENKLVVFQNLL
ncbi:MAG: hypothetical protein E4H26_08070, partial [Flavobacteriales bacterium]